MLNSDGSNRLPNAESCRLPAGHNYRFLAGPHGNLILRPWFDTIALNFVASWFCPLSRAWAAASISDGLIDRFREELDVPSLNLAQFASAIRKVSIAHAEFRDISEAWERIFFTTKDPAQRDLIDSYTALFKSEQRQLAMRRFFLSLRPHVPPLKWEIATPEEVEAKQAGRLAGCMFTNPENSEIVQSASILGEWGEEYHLKMCAPVGSTDDIARAHVFMPEDGEVKGTLHGIGLEPVMWDALAHPAKALTRQGIRVVLPTGPWHGRRAPKGLFGGEHILRRGPLGFIEGFHAWVSEVALWIRWARTTADAPVGLGGVSLGALTAQIAATAASDWSESDRPDALLLITTTGDMRSVAFESNIGEKLGLTNEIKNYGWTEENLERWLPLLQPGQSLAVKPEKIVMLLGSADRLTPFEGGVALAEQWKIPEENLFIRRQGHFSGALGLSHDATPLKRFATALLQA